MAHTVGKHMHTVTTGRPCNGQQHKPARSNHMAGCLTACRVTCSGAVCRAPPAKQMGCMAHAKLAEHSATSFLHCHHHDRNIHMQDASSAVGVSKVASSPVPLQVLLTEHGSTFASWKLLCNPLPSSLDHYRYLWPDESKVVLLCL